MVHAGNPKLLRRLRQEDGKFETSLGNSMRHCLKIKNGRGYSSVVEYPGLTSHYHQKIKKEKELDDKYIFVIPGQLLYIPF